MAEGWHEGPGLPHAEAMALAAAGDAARGATVVCTLEPCSHHGRTPPCADALVAAGVARVVVGPARPAGARPRPGRGGAARGGDRGRRRRGRRRRRLRRADRPVPRPRRDRAARGDPQARDEPRRQDRDGDGGEPLDLGAGLAGPRAPLAGRRDAVARRASAPRWPTTRGSPRATCEGPVRQPARVVFDSPGDAAAPLRAGPHRAGAAGDRAGRRGRAGRPASWPWRRWASRWSACPGRRRSGSSRRCARWVSGGSSRCSSRAGPAWPAALLAGAARSTASPGSSRRS